MTEGEGFSVFVILLSNWRRCEKLAGAGNFWPAPEMAPVRKIGRRRKWRRLEKLAGAGNGAGVKNWPAPEMAPEVAETVS